MATPTPRLVTTSTEVLRGVSQFQAELNNSPIDKGLAPLLSSFQSWYAIKDESGHVRYAPSKFVGYSEMTSDAYLQSNQRTDGRATESVLSKWFDRPSENQEQQLLEGLSIFLNKFGKQLNRRARVSTLGGRAILFRDETENVMRGPSVVDALHIIYQSLSADEKKELRNRIIR